MITSAQPPEAVYFNPTDKFNLRACTGFSRHTRCCRNDRDEEFDPFFGLVDLADTHFSKQLEFCEHEGDSLNLIMRFGLSRHRTSSSRRMSQNDYLCWLPATSVRKSEVRNAP